ncbi:MAG: hypothetical protein BroJett021_34850 [Chloroflexota bacterium]|nr:MAG: hypothetical protein BroJett021_34850 [Chloroflexota bacterium]
MTPAIPAGQPRSPLVEVSTKRAERFIGEVVRTGTFWRSIRPLDTNGPVTHVGEARLFPISGA